MMQSIAPDPDDTRALRTALGRFATGVTVVTTDSEIGPLGITANSFASVSLDPPLILWSPARGSRRFDAFATAANFAVHVLGEEQFEVGQQFQKQGHDFDGLDWALGAHDVPLIEGCLARFECKQKACHDGGDHVIVVAEVTRAHRRDGAPLVFCQGQYGSFNITG